jgi:hypothetical protein
MTSFKQARAIAAENRASLAEPVVRIVETPVCRPDWCQPLMVVHRAMTIDTPHELAAVLQPNYFRRCQHRLEPGDFLFVRTSAGEFAILAVKEVREGSSGDPGAVVVVPMVSGHRAITADGEAVA